MQNANEEAIIYNPKEAEDEFHKELFVVYAIKYLVMPDVGR